MKPITIITTLVLTAFSTAAFSQQENDKSTNKDEKKPKWVIGITVGNSLMRNPIYSPFDGPGKLSEYSVGVNSKLFARYHINDNFALETGLQGTYFMSRKRNPTNYYPKASALMVEVPIGFQYHFFSSKARFRPYIGVGASIYYSISKYEENYNGSSVGGNTYIYNNTDVVPFSITQGFTFQVTDKLQLNQSLKYRLGAAATLNVNFGIGYTIGK